MPRGSGRRPLPTALKKLRGNPGRRPLNVEEPKPLAGEPDMPRTLGAIAQQKWRELVPALLAMGVLTTIDGTALEACCMNYQLWVLALGEIQARGIMIDEPVFNKRGNEVGTQRKRNPAIGVANEADRRFRSYLVEFGMTPASRSRLKTEKSPEDEDPESAYVRRHLAKAGMSGPIN